MMEKHALAAKLSIITGSVSAVLAPAVATAAIVHVNNRPVSVSFANLPSGNSVAYVPWDVDGDGTAEFEFRKDARSGFYWAALRDFYWQIASINFGSALAGRPRGNGRGVLASGSFGWEFPMRLPQSFDVGQTLAAYHWLSSPFTGGNSIQILKSRKSETRINGVLQSSYAYLRMGYGLYSGMFQPGDNFVGFRFDDGAGNGLNYGWAIWNIDLTPGAAAITITEWAYQSGDDAAIHVGSVPAPPASVAALTLLAMGAAGLRGWRRRTAAGATASGLPDRSPASPE